MDGNGPKKTLENPVNSFQVPTQTTHSAARCHKGPPAWSSQRAVDYQMRSRESGHSCHGNSSQKSLHVEIATESCWRILKVVWFFYISHSPIWHSSRFAPAVERVISDTCPSSFVCLSNNSRNFCFGSRMAQYCRRTLLWRISKCRSTHVVLVPWRTSKELLLTISLLNSLAWLRWNLVRSKSEDKNCMEMRLQYVLVVLRNAEMDKQNRWCWQGNNLLREWRENSMLYKLLDKRGMRILQQLCCRCTTCTIVVKNCCTIKCSTRVLF